MLVSYVGVLLVLVSILVAIAAVARWLRGASLLGSAGARTSRMEVLERVPLGPRQGVALVRVGGQVVLLSVGDGGVRRLHALDETATQLLLQDPDDASGSPSTGDTGRPTFPQALRQAIRRTLVGGALLALLAPATAHAQRVPPAPVTATTPAPTPAATPAAPTTGAEAAPPVDRAPGAGAAAATVVERLAPRMDLRVGREDGDGLRLNGTVGVVVMLGLLSLLPTLVLMSTAFTRILVVLYFLRQALGTQTSPPGPLVAGLALILTGFVMTPTMTRLNQEALTPWLDGRIEQVEMLERGAVPLRDFMLRQTRPADVRRMVRLSRQPAVAGEPVPFLTLMAAFTVSELRTAFTIGFALFLPFIVIDVVVAAVLMSLGMFMLPPTMIALPFKLLLFVLVDGWGLIAQSLVAGFR